MSQASQVRTYDPAASVVFLKTNERFGGLSNMAPGFPLRVNGVRIRTSEALYQACRFPHLPDVQRKIIDEHSPMTAKMRSKPFRKDSRPDWDAVRVKIMRWCLRVKLAQNWQEFGRLLLATGDRPIVEQSRKDDFWGAKVADDGSLIGMNVLGRLLMELREHLKGDEAESLRFIEPLAIPEFLLLRQPIETICAGGVSSHPSEVEPRPSRPVASPPPRDLPQPSLFDQPMIAKGQMDIQQSNRPAEANSSENPMPYIGYRDSGLPWLGRIPEHWEVRRNGRLFAERNQTGFEDLPILEVSLRTGVRVRDMENGARKQQMTDRSKYKRAAKGDIAYNMMRMWQGAVGVAPVDGLISPAYVVAGPFPEVESRYYAYLFRTDAYKREVNKFSRGIVSDRNRLYWDEFKQMPSAFPPTEEQTQIADFLDAHGRLTARLIRNKRRLIGLLNEQKQAIINQAVTRGLNPDAPMKPTGIDWMPEVPAHWEVKPLKHWLRQRARMLSDKTDPDYEFDYLDISCVGTGYLVAKPERMKFENAPSRARQIVEKGDTLISTVRTYLKAVYYVEDEWSDLIASTGFAVLRPVSAVQPKLLGYVLQSSSFIERVIRASIGVAYPAISEAQLGTLHVALPRDLSEQNDILECIGSETAAFDSAIEKAQREITLIHEYRERLIADIITGKLDVRHVEITAPAGELDIGEAEDLEGNEETAANVLMEEADVDD
jgi:type I restriction enzyme S subunit